MEEVKSTRNGSDTKRVMMLFYILLSLAMLFTAFGAGPDIFNEPRPALTAMLWALASASCGTIIGFLFGIPKILQKTNGTLKVPAPEKEYQTTVNTNLIEISDWLTKIIVGLGLVHLSELPPFVLNKARILSSSLASTDPNHDYLGFSVSVIVTFSCMGFLFGYLATRLYLAAAFSRADQEAMHVSKTDKEKVEKLAKALPEEPIPPDPGPSSGNTSSQDEIPQAALQIIQSYNIANTIENVQIRVSEKSKVAAAFKAYLKTNKLAKDSILKHIFSGGEEGAICMLAIAIAISPEISDIDRVKKALVFRVSTFCKVKLSEALSLLSALPDINSDQITILLDILDILKGSDSDPGLQGVIKEKRAVIELNRS